MLDIRLLREDTEEVVRRLNSRGGSFDEVVRCILLIDTERREAETEKQVLQGARNRLSKEIGIGRSVGADTSELEARGKALNDGIERLGVESEDREVRQRDLLLGLPNLPHVDCPMGVGAEDNPEVRVWGERREFLFEPKDHQTLGAALGMLDFEGGARLTGAGFVVFRGAGAKLERALISWLLDWHTTEHGYTEITPPILVKRECMVGTGQLPKFEGDMFGVEDNNRFLLPTAEVALMNLYRDTIMNREELPAKFAAHTPCFRREAGSAGRETRGLIRMHQFDKVELVQTVTPDAAFEALEELTGHAEAVLQKLGLHYRVIELCTGDIGFSATKTYDIEVWAPGQNQYLEVSSCSNVGDFQARRMNLRFKDEEKKNRFPHTLNGSGTALPRLMVALMETYQREDGGIDIPEILRPYVGVDKVGS